ncbi:MAG TPA: hypothetical protein VG674_10650 [Amycolatopsis sp.]|jgi:hypothetical protein|nr:hypothetical protein [Amycolatopsis sp.]
MKAGTRMALGVAAGYLLGRTKKGRLALMIAAAGATGKAGVSPAKLVQSGLKQLSSSEEVGKLTSLARDELLTAAKSAAVTAASGKIESLSERLQEGDVLSRVKKARGKSEADSEEDDTADVDEERDVDEEQDEDQEEPAPAKRRQRRSTKKRPADEDDTDEDSAEEDGADEDSAEEDGADEEGEEEEPTPRRRSPSKRAASSGGSGRTRTATRRSPVRRARR